MTAARDPILKQMLPDGRRLHLRDGPIDLIIGADGAPGEVAAAYRQAAGAFDSVLARLAAELDILRRPAGPAATLPAGRIARRMARVSAAVAGGAYATPMICVAGAVADHVLRAMIRGRGLARAYVNNGGDIALALSPGAAFDVGICADPGTGRIASRARIASGDGVGGIATSGWRGRSLSLGIADAVTVLARDAARADAAATLIANAVDCPGHPGITRRAACALAPDSDLGQRLVTTGVGPLAPDDIAGALARGAALARDMIAAGHIRAAHGLLHGRSFHAESDASMSLSSHPRAAAHA